LRIFAPTNWASGAFAYCISRAGMAEVIRIFEEDDYFPCFDMCFDHWSTQVYEMADGTTKKLLDGFYILNHIPLIDATWSPSAVVLEDQQPPNQENTEQPKEE
jgi:hypothetical protein